MLKSGGIQEGCGIEASDYRHLLNNENIQILADVHDRVGYPLLPVPITQASRWAVRTRADGLILTGHSFEESLKMITTVKQSGINQPILIGGSVNENNIGEVLKIADGAIVRSALKKDKNADQDLVRWDIGKTSRFMEKINQQI